MSVINPVISQVIRPVTQPPTKPPKGGGGGNPALTRDLEAWWEMSGGTNAGETDSTGNIDLAKGGVGTLGFDTTRYRTRDRSRVVGTGSSNFLTTTTAAPAVLQPSGDFTFMIWAWPPDTTTRDLCGVWAETGDERAWRILHNATGFRFEISSDGTAGTVTSVQGGSAGAQVWSFVCVTRKGNTLSLYVNGAAAVTGSFSGAMHTSTASFDIADAEDSANPSFTSVSENGRFDAAAMWSRALRARDINERATSLYANGAGLDYASLGNGRGYASLSAAESSGDSWKNAENIRCVNGQRVVDFRYYSALAVGHSGLIHRFPLNNGTEVSAPTLLGSGDSGDPDNWTDWSDVPTIGTKGVDYDFRSAGGRAILEDLGTASSRFNLQTDNLTTDTLTTAFVIIDDLSGESNKFFGPTIIMRSYKDAGNDWNTALAQRSASTTWHYLDSSGYTNSGKNLATEARWWVYIMPSGACAYWYDDEVAPVFTGTAQTSAFPGLSRVFLRDSDNLSGDTTEISLSNIIYGHFGS